MARGEVLLEVDAEGAARPEPALAPVDEARPEDPFHLLVLGDLSGRGGRETSPAGEANPLAERSPISVDRDDVDQAVDELAPVVEIPLGAVGARGSGAGTAAAADDSPRPTLTIRFRSVEDFHPDRLHGRLRIFDEIREAHRAHDGEDLAGGGPTDAPDDSSTDAPDEPPTSARSGGLLEEIVEEAEGPDDGSGGTVPGTRSSGAGEDAGEGSGGLSEYVRRIVRPHLVPEPGARERARRERLEAAVQQTMRAILHHPRFQALEAVWRSVRLLVRRVETGPDLKIFLLDVSREELERALPAGRDPSESPLHGPLVGDRKGVPGGTPWGAIVGLYDFRPDDAALLGRLARLSRAAGGPFLAGAAPELAGLETFRHRPSRSDWSEVERPEWRELRRSEEARWVGLALPRFLLRQPYDPDDAPCRALDLREIPDEAGEMDPEDRHGRYLWGNPACLCASLLCRSFRRAGWEMRPGMDREMERLPLHIYERDGRAEAKPSAEMLMTEEVAERLLERGFIPLASVKERGAARVVRFQSVADPPRALAGRWTGARSG